MHLLPKSEALLEDFAEHAKLMVEATRVLSEHGAPTAREVGKLEERGHGIIVHVIRSLRTTFLTPLDRDDLFALALALDAAFAAVEAVAYGRSSAGDANEDVGGRAVKTLADAVLALRNEKEHDAVRESCFAVKELGRAQARKTRGRLVGRDPSDSGEGGAAGGASEAGANYRIRERDAESIAAVYVTCAAAADAILAALLDS